jgi:hypothetical protein
MRNREILMSSEVTAPEAARPLIHELDRYSATSGADRVR